MSLLCSVTAELESTVSLYGRGVCWVSKSSCKYMLNPFKTAVPLWGQTIQILGSFAPKTGAQSQHPYKGQYEECTPKHLGMANPSRDKRRGVSISGWRK